MVSLLFSLYPLQLFIAPRGTPSNIPFLKTEQSQLSIAYSLSCNDHDRYGIHRIWICHEKGWIPLHLQRPPYILFSLKVSCQLVVGNHQRIRHLSHFWHYLIVGIITLQRFNHLSFISPYSSLITHFPSLHMKLRILHCASISFHSPSGFLTQLTSLHTSPIMGVLFF